MAGDSESREGYCRWPKVVLYGDSLTQKGFEKEGCWASLVADYLIRKCDVCNRGFSGYVTSWCKLALPKLITTEEADVVAMFTLFLGANDSNDKELNPRQHVPLEEYRENLITMVEYLQSIGISKEKIVMIGPPAVDEEKWSKIAKEEHNSTSGKSDKLTHAYAKACGDAAKTAGVEFIDFFTQMKKVETWREMLNDGLHLSAKGATFLFELLKPAIDQRIAHLPVLLPEWKDVDHNNPQAQFDSL